MIWEIIGAVGALLAVLSGLFWWATKWLLDRYHQDITRRFEEVAGAQHRLERDVLQLRAELPEKYVRREDWIRFASVIDAKLDALRAAIEAVKEKLYVR